MLGKIKETCNYVVNNSKYVKINYENLDKFINNIKYSECKNWLLSNPYNLLDLDIETIINILLIFESIDYSFYGEPKWKIATDEGEKDGSDALLYVLINYVKKNKNTEFSKLTFCEFKQLLKGNVEIPLLKERYNTIIEISRIVNKKMNGNFYKYVKDINQDIKLFDIITRNFPSFEDKRLYKGKTIYFYKLAQLLTSDILHIREKIENIVVDYSNIIGCADYKIPQTLRALEILEYDEKLSDIVDQRKEIKVSSEYEVEIRASQIKVLDYISKKLNNIKSIDINDFIFMYSKKIKDNVKPYHLCRNKNY